MSHGKSHACLKGISAGAAILIISACSASNAEPLPTGSDSAYEAIVDEELGAVRAKLDGASEELFARIQACHEEADTSQLPKSVWVSLLAEHEWSEIYGAVMRVHLDNRRNCFGTAELKLGHWIARTDKSLADNSDYLALSENNLAAFRETLEDARSIHWMAEPALLDMEAKASNATAEAIYDVRSIIGDTHFYPVSVAKALVELQPQAASEQ